ncbi:MAG TPA: DUF4010 domain-containing protein, partial [Methyloceanibacter sp.]
FAVILLVTKFVQAHFPPSGLCGVAALAGLTDVDAITLSMSEFAQTGEARGAVIAIVIAALSNTLAKCAWPSCWQALRSASRSPSPRQQP